MKRLATIVIAGAFIGSGLLAAGAQDASDILQDAVAHEEPDAQEVPQEPSLLYAIQLIQQAEVHAEAIAALPEVPGVEVVNLSMLPTAEASRHVFEETMTEFILRNQDQIHALRHALSANDMVAEALADAGVESSEILAAEIRPDMALRVYLRDW